MRIETTTSLGTKVKVRLEPCESGMRILSYKRLKNGRWRRAKDMEGKTAPASQFGVTSLFDSA